MEKSKIYIIQSGSNGSDVIMSAFSEDGDYLAGHYSSTIRWGRHDMGLDGSDWKHDSYGTRYPEGYDLEFVEDGHTHPGFLNAYAKHVNKYGGKESPDVDEESE